MPTQKPGKRGKRPRKHKFTDPLVAAKRNIQTEINKAEKKIKKLLRLREEKRKTKNQLKKLRSDDGREIKETSITRYQGMAFESERHRKLKSYIQRLKNRLNEISGKTTADTFLKRGLY